MLYYRAQGRCRGGTEKGFPRVGTFGVGLEGCIGVCQSQGKMKKGIPNGRRSIGKGMNE